MRYHNILFLVFITLSIFHFIAQNQADAAKNNELNLHDHPILPLHPDKKDDDFGRIVPMDIAQGFGKDDKDVRR